ncbi:MAG: peptidylprolyl isomerase [Candidatus Poseidoniales archaeon]
MESDENIPFEANANLTHINGAVGMARSVDPDSASSQFYICDGPQHGLDNGNRSQDDDPGYAVFGVVREGMELVKAAAQVPTSNDPLNRPLYEVHVNSITLQGFVSSPTNEKENENTPSISFSLSIISIGLLTLLRRKLIMDSIIFQGNVIGMLAYIVPAMLFFSWIIKEVEEDLVERKLYIACGLGVVLGTGADIIMILGGINTYNEDIGYASKVLVSPIIILIFLFIGVNRKNFQAGEGELHTILQVLDFFMEGQLNFGNY